MHFLLAALTGLALAMDCFAVALCMGGLNRLKTREYALVPLHFGIFQGAMLALGFFLGIGFEKLISGIDHWIAFFLLFGVGAKLIWESFQSEQRERVTSERELLMLSIATSIDALVVGIALSLAEAEVLVSAIVVGSVTLLLSLAGLMIGERLRHCKFTYAGIAGGLVLIGIGVKILVQHTLA